MKFLGIEELKSELIRLKKENEELKSKNEDLGYKLYWSKEAYKRLHEENEKLKRGIKRLKKEVKALENKQKESNIINISINKEDIKNAAEHIAKELNKSEEHKCTPECFRKHIIKAIQNDYNSCSKETKSYFLKYWFDNLLEYYPWLESLYIIDSKIYFKSKESSI